MKNKQRLTAMLLAGCLAVSSVPVAFAVDAPERQEQVADQAREDSKTAAPTEGACGENAAWKLEGGTLTISGTGEMSNYGSNDAPWYDSRSSITRVVVGQGITSLGDWTFSDCDSLTSVIIPDSVTKIGAHAFFGCDKLNSVTIPNSVTSIGDSAFENCSSLSSVTIPNSITEIPYGAFAECENLINVTIPDSVASIGSDAFFDCSNLISITIPDSVTSIGEEAFSSCVSLKNVVLSNGITVIRRFTFSGCESLTEIYIPDGVTYISMDAFSSTGLKSVTIPSSVTEIEGWAFEYCQDLTSVTIPDSMEYIGRFAFLRCPKLKNIVIPANTSVDVYAFGMDFYSHGDTEEYYVIDDFVATVTEGSDGERYCKENGIKYETSHSFTNYVYNNDAQVGKDGTETATCDNGCGTTDTRIKKGTALPEPTTSVTELFCDVPSSAWYVDYVQFVYDNGLMNGTSETTFEPETTLSRAMVAQILYNRAGKPDVSGEAKFNDVPKDQWYYQAVQWAGEQGIVNGVGDGKFAPQADVTREQLAMMLYNAQGKPETDVSLSGFEDTNTISDWAVSAVKWAVNEKIINGSKENEKLYINPMGNATRAEAATMFTRYDQEFD